MHIRDLSPREQLHLCSMAEHHCVRLLRSLARRARPRSTRLAKVLMEMARDEEGHERAILQVGESVDWPEFWQLTRDSSQELLHRHFPACLRSADRLQADEEKVMEFVEQLENQSSDFYRCLADQSSDPVLRAFFLYMKCQEEAHLRQSFINYLPSLDEQDGEPVREP